MKKFFNTPRQIIKTVYDPITLEHFTQLLDRERPTEIWHTGWSDKKPCLSITEYNWPIFMGRWNWDAGRELEPMDAEKVFRHLKYQGFGECYINSKEEEKSPITPAKSLEYEKDGKIERRFTKEWVNTMGTTNLDNLPRYIGSLVVRKRAMCEYIEALHDEIDSLKAQIEQAYLKM